MATLNEELNPTRMTPKVRAKLREARLNTGEGKTYQKFHGRHEHRKRNNEPENLMIFPSQAEHAAWHKANDKGGDAK